MEQQKNPVFRLKKKVLPLQKNMMKELSLAKYVLPSETADYFDIVEISEQGEILHIQLEEKNIIPEEYSDKELSPNGFYESSKINDFPLRDKKVILHVRRRRWTDKTGKSYSRAWDLTAEGTRYSKEFASFLKEAFGYCTDSSPIA